MKNAPLLLTMILLAPLAAARAGDPPVPLDKDYSFRLAPPASPQPPAATLPGVPSDPPTKRAGRVPLTTPEGVRLPPGSRPLEFNGQTFYFIPL